MTREPSDKYESGKLKKKLWKDGQAQENKGSPSGQYTEDENETLSAPEDLILLRKEMILHDSEEYRNLFLKTVQSDRLISEITRELEHALQDDPDKLRNNILLILDNLRDRTSAKSRSRIQSGYYSLHQSRVYSIIREKIPSLTENECMLCIFLAMRMNTKQIAETLHISTETVNLNRHRLRKKLGLSKDKNLAKAIDEIIQK